MRKLLQEGRVVSFALPQAGLARGFRSCIPVEELREIGGCFLVNLQAVKLWGRRLNRAVLTVEKWWSTVEWAARQSGEHGFKLVVGFLCSRLVRSPRRQGKKAQ